MPLKVDYGSCITNGTCLICKREFRFNNKSLTQKLLKLHMEKEHNKTTCVAYEDKIHTIRCNKNTTQLNNAIEKDKNKVEIINKLKSLGINK
jgi:hypothetical protein